MSRPSRPKLDSRRKPGRPARACGALLALALAAALAAAPLHVLEHESDSAHAVCAICSALSGLGTAPCVSVIARPVVPDLACPLGLSPDPRISPVLGLLRVRAPPSA